MAYVVYTEITGAGPAYGVVAGENVLGEKRSRLLAGIDLVSELALVSAHLLKSKRYFDSLRKLSRERQLAELQRLRREARLARQGSAGAAEIADAGRDIQRLTGELGDLRRSARALRRQIDQATDVGRRAELQSDLAKQEARIAQLEDDLAKTKADEALAEAETARYSEPETASLPPEKGTASARPAPTTPLPGPSPPGGAGWRIVGDRVHSPLGELRIEGDLFGKGGFADVHRLLDADGRPTGYVIKRYSDTTGDFGRRGLLTTEKQRAMVGEIDYGSGLLDDADILQAEIVYADPDAAGGGLVIQRQLGTHLPEGVSREVRARDLINTRRAARRRARAEAGTVTGDRFAEAETELMGPRSRDAGPTAQPTPDPVLTRAEQEAVVDLFDRFASKGLIWEDAHSGNIFFRYLEDGRVEAGILDQDRIGIWNREVGEIKGWRETFEFAPNVEGIRSLTGIDHTFPDPHFFMAKMAERKGWIKFDPDAQAFRSGLIDLDVFRKRFPDFEDWIGDPASAGSLRGGGLGRQGLWLMPQDRLAA